MMPLFQIAGLELSRLFATRRGLIAIIGFSLVWLLVLVYAIRPAAEFLQSPDIAGSTGALFEWLGWTALADWDVPQVALYWPTALYLLPLFSVVIAADQFASDKTRGTLRYLTLRVSRWQLFFGRFAGQCVVQAVLAIATFASVLLLLAWVAPERVADATKYGPVIVSNLILVLMPYVALMSLVSVVARSARQATLFAIIIWVVLSLTIALLQARFQGLQSLVWLIPGVQISSLLKLQGWDTMSLAHVPVVHTVVLLVAGWWAMHKTNL